MERKLLRQLRWLLQPVIRDNLHWMAVPQQQFFEVSPAAGFVDNFQQMKMLLDRGRKPAKPWWSYHGVWALGQSFPSFYLVQGEKQRTYELCTLLHNGTSGPMRDQQWKLTPMLHSLKAQVSFLNEISVSAGCCPITILRFDWFCLCKIELSGVLVINTGLMMESCFPLHNGKLVLVCNFRFKPYLFQRNWIKTPENFQENLWSGLGDLAKSGSLDGRLDLHLALYITPTNLRQIEFSKGTQKRKKC